MGNTFERGYVTTDPGPDAECVPRTCRHCDSTCYVPQGERVGQAVYCRTCVLEDVRKQDAPSDADFAEVSDMSPPRDLPPSPVVVGVISTSRPQRKLRPPPVAVGDFSASSDLPFPPP